MTNLSAFRLPGDDLLHLGKKPSQGPCDSIFVKSKGGGLGGAGKNVRKDRSRADQEKALQEDAPTAEMVAADTPRAETPKERPKAVLKKAGWTDAVTKLNTDAEIFAEFDVPPEVGDRTLLDFQVLRKERDEFKPYEKAQGHVDKAGRASVKVPLRKAKEPKSVFCFKVKHCSSDWSNGTGTEREVSETAEVSCEHTQVSGIHFPKGKSFIADIYLDALAEVKKTYSDWKKTHDKAQLVVYGHCESDEGENPLVLSRNRGLSVFSFLIGDVDRWADLAEKERWGVWEQQCMLRALGFFKVKPTGNLGPKTRQAVQDFIVFLNEARCMNINPMLGLSEAYIRKELYREYLNVRRSEMEIPSSAFRTVAGFPYVGCCAFNRYRSDKSLHDENRRAVILILKESPNFPMAFPCRSGTVGPCESECKKPGDRSNKGFGCKFYDEMVKQEKVGDAENSGNGHEIETHWKGFPGQNDFNDAIYEAAKKNSIDPLILKSLIAQESSFKPKIYNALGFAGLTQVGGPAIKEAGLHIGTTAKIEDKWVYDKQGDERFDPKKSINAGAKILSIKRDRVNKLVFSKFKQMPSEDERWRFYLAAYNGGEGVVRNAWVNYGSKDCSWEDLIKPSQHPKRTALYKAIPKSYGDIDQKFEEISEYSIQIMERRNS